MKLTLGCGQLQLTLPPNVTSKDEWVSVDIRPEIQPDIVADFTQLDEYIAPASADAVYSCHSLEHVDRELVYPTLHSWWKVLKPGGQLIVRVPNFLRGVKHWVELESEEQIFRMNLFYGPGRDSQRHLNGFTPYSLQRYAEMAGFQVESSDEYESRYGVPNGDLLLQGIKQDRRKDNPNHWVPICAWNPQPFSKNFQMITDFCIAPFFHLQKKKYINDIWFYEAGNAVCCKKMPSGQPLLGQIDPMVEIQRTKEWNQKQIDSTTQALIVFGDSLRFIPALLQTRVIDDGLPVVIFEPETEHLAAALALFDLGGIPRDGRWQFVPQMISTPECEALFNRMGLPLMHAKILVNPRLPNAGQIGHQLDQMLMQQKLLLTNQKDQLTKLSAPSAAKPRVMFLAFHHDRDAGRIVKRTVGVLRKHLGLDAASYFLQRRGQDCSPDHGPMFYMGELLHVIHQFKPTKILCIGVSPLECFSLSLLDSLGIPVAYIHTSAMIGPQSAHSSFETIVNERQALPVLDRMECQAKRFIPLACDVELCAVPQETENTVVFCQDATAMTAWERMEFLSLFAMDRPTQQKLSGLPYALKDERDLNLFAFIFEEFPDVEFAMQLRILDYLYRETTFLYQCGMLRMLKDLPLRILGFGWKDVLSNDDPLRECIETNPTSTFNFEKLKRARVALNIPSIVRNTGPNGWFFRIPAMGVSQVCDFRSAFETFLPDIAYYHSPEECADIVRQQVSDIGPYRERIRSCQEQIQQKHQYAHRMQEWLASGTDG